MALALASPTKRLIPVQQLQKVELQVIEALQTSIGRGKDGISEEQQAKLDQAIQTLEASGGVPAPTTVPALEGKWKLLYTSRPGTASPIQRTFTGIDAFIVYQEIEFGGDLGRVSNIVDFGPKIGYLRVEAEASTESKPLPGFTPRANEGFALLGKSFTYSPARANMRIDFQFDKAAFYFSFLPFSIPYPVPFRILGDERKGWLDVTYMNKDGTLRLSRGNKGTLFILTKDIPLKTRLLEAIEQQDDDMVFQLVQLMEADSPTQKPARSSLTGGKWRQIWTRQSDTAAALQKLGSKQSNGFQIIDLDAGELQNLVQFSSWARLSATATCKAISDTRTEVFITDAGFYLGPLKIPISVPRSEGRNPGFVEWLYLDEDIRITRGSQGSYFIHRREESM